MKVSENLDKNWYVLYTKSRNEKKVAERLIGAGYNAYCPLLRVCRQWSDRIKIIEEPLFKGYIFIQVEDAKREVVFNFPGTVRYLFWLRRPAVVRDSEIRIIQKLLGEHSHEGIDVSCILPGNYLRITSGPLAGEQALVLDKTNKKAIVQLKELGIQISLSLTNSDLSLR